MLTLVEDGSAVSWDELFHFLNLARLLIWFVFAANIFEHHFDLTCLIMFGCNFFNLICISGLKINYWRFILCWRVLNLLENVLVGRNNFEAQSESFQIRWWSESFTGSWRKFRHKSTRRSMTWLDESFITRSPFNVSLFLKLACLIISSHHLLLWTYFLWMSLKACNQTIVQ